MSAKTTNPNQAHAAAHKPETVKPVATQAAELIPAIDLAVAQQIGADPRLARPTDILALQRVAGNRAVSRLIQTQADGGLSGRSVRAGSRSGGRASDDDAAPSRRPNQRFNAQPEEEEELQMKPLALR